MREIKYYCDACHNEKDKDSLSTLYLTITKQNQDNKQTFVDVCDECLGELGYKNEVFNHKEVEKSYKKWVKWFIFGKEVK